MHDSIPKQGAATALVALITTLALGCGDTTETPTGRSIAAADATFLIPLGSVADFAAGTEAGHGVLLPRERFDALDPLTVVDEPDDLYAHLDVVGVRLDPCFFEGEGAVVCSSQIRLVLQPVFEQDGSPVNRDAAVHAFYAVPETELSTLVTALAELRQAAGGQEVIGAHPNPSAARAEILPYVGRDRLTRVTFVAVHASDQAWTFGGFDIADGNATPIEILGVGDPEQHLTSTGGLETLDATILPAPAIETDIADYLSLTSRASIAAPAEEAALAALDRLLDPAAHNPGTVDCASCHMATPAMYFAAAKSGAAAGFSPAYANSQNQRMFGFYDAAPSISPRVEAETLQVLDRLRSLLEQAQ
ncbi:MAG: hypothetical protein H6736_00375 [Alphaproteobacteria bacterium]|nr:hypothetical protein [Alphaproteobacteria bacterium]